jgi:hypothetical protein
MELFQSLSGRSTPHPTRLSPLEIREPPRIQSACAAQAISVRSPSNLRIQRRIAGATGPSCYTSSHMLVYKCDACKKPIPDSERDSTLVVGFGLARNHLCKRCAAPIVRALKGLQAHPIEDMAKKTTLKELGEMLSFVVKRMATKDDIADLRKEMATKDDLAAVETRLDRRIEVLDGKLD